MKSISIQPTGIAFHPNSRRVIVRPFITKNARSIQHIIKRAMSLSEEEIDKELDSLCDGFKTRHIDLEGCWRQNYTLIRSFIDQPILSLNRQLYLGALFSGEYALESAALFNPSMVPHPDQDGLEEGAVRILLSLRATGEGHISSIEFRSGILHADGEIKMDPTSSVVVAPEIVENPTYVKEIFIRKLKEMGFENRFTSEIMGKLSENFTRAELNQAIQEVPPKRNSHQAVSTSECIDWLAKSNYEIHFHPSVPLSQRIIFPVSPNESNGIEDARFVRFCDEGDRPCYYATYTAYNGRAILPQFIETSDFRTFRILTLNGNAVQNKGMALFPRRVNGRYAMISRQDDENLYLMYSDHLHFWNDPILLRAPEYPWEFVKIGNCGSHLETPEGWLVITHGVGAMRRYCMGALLLDIDDPSKVLGALQKPLLEARDEEREGYVPNVVYSCGSMIHGNQLILPYAVSDTSSTIVKVDLNDLLKALRS